MKNAYALEHHHGDDGNVTEGMILEGVPQKRFDVLEKKGLVREASGDEVAKGYKAPFAASGTITAGEEGGERSAPDPSNKAAPEPANKAAPKARDK